MDGEAAHPAGQRLTEPKGERPRAGSASAEAPPRQGPPEGAPRPPTQEAPPHKGGIDVNAACQEAPQKSGPLEEQHRPLPAHRQVADLVDNHQRRMGQHAQAAGQLSGRLGLRQRLDQSRQRAVGRPDSAVAIARLIAK